MPRAPSIVAAAFTWAVVGAAFVGVELASGGGASPAQNLVALQIAPAGTDRCRHRAPGRVVATVFEPDGRMSLDSFRTDEFGGLGSASA